MFVYIGLVVFILFFSIFIKMTVKDRAKQEHTILSVSMIIIFLILALKNETVGIDIIGYKEYYEYGITHSLSSESRVHYEIGYIWLTKFLGNIGVGFRWFLAGLYAFLCYSLYRVIKKYSTNVTLSVIIFVCYQTFVFSLSGIRQTFAMALCLWSFMLFESGKLKNKVFAIIVIVVAMLFHESAIVFFIIPIVLSTKKRFSLTNWIMLGTASIIFRGVIWAVVKFIYDKTITAYDFGGNLLFLIAVAMFSYVAHKTQVHELGVATKEDVTGVDNYALKIFFACIIANIVFSGGTLLRSAMYFSIFLIPFLPRFVTKFEPKIRAIIIMVLVVLLMVFFYDQSIAKNQLNMLPYKFFWQ